MAWTLIIALGLHLAAGVAQGLECPNDWVSFQDSCYVFVDDVATWTGAQIICGLLKGHIVEIGSSEENNFIVSQMKIRQIDRSWLGLNDFVHEGRYVWSSSNEPVEYTNWAVGEPNDSGSSNLGDQDCGAIYVVNGTWDDEFCESAHPHPFFCEQTYNTHEIISG